MFKQLSYTRKNKLLLPIAGAGILLCWFFAFNKTFEAMRLHNELQVQSQVNSQAISFQPEHTRRKLDALEGILKSYHVKEADWSNELWMKASSLAMKQGVGIDYILNIPGSERDTTAVGLSQSLYCYGDFNQLIRLMDTLEHSRGIGKVYALQIKAPKAEVMGDRAGKSSMKMEFRALGH